MNARVTRLAPSSRTRTARERSTLPRSAWLLVSDDPASVDSIVRDLRRYGCTTFVAHDGDSAIALAQRECPVSVLLHDRAGAPGISVFGLLATLRALLPDASVVVLSERASIQAAVRAIRSGADDYLPLPVDAGVLPALAGAASRTRRTSMVAQPRETMSLGALKWSLIQDTLRDCGGNITRAARRLSLHRRSLQRVLQRHHAVGEPAGVAVR